MAPRIYGDLFAPRRQYDPYQPLVDALEAARKSVCTYMGPTCDCKWGLVLPDALAEAVLLNARNCKHNHCEHTGCPELRYQIGLARTAQRAYWASRSEVHGRTPTHDWPCCEQQFPCELPTDSLNRVCGGPGRCPQCTTEADRIHGLLPPLEVADDAPPA